MTHVRRANFPVSEKEKIMYLKTLAVGNFLLAWSSTEDEEVGASASTSGFSQTCMASLFSSVSFWRTTPAAKPWPRSRSKDSIVSTSGAANTLRMRGAGAEDGEGVDDCGS